MQELINKNILKKKIIQETNSVNLLSNTRFKNGAPTNRRVFSHFLLLYEPLFSVASLHTINLFYILFFFLVKKIHTTRKKRRDNNYYRWMMLKTGGGGGGGGQKEEEGRGLERKRRSLRLSDRDHYLLFYHQKKNL